MRRKPAARTAVRGPNPPGALALPLDPRALDALGAFLASPATGGRAMDLHMLQGLAAGLALGPRVISPALWLPWVWDRDHGVQPPAFDSIEQFNTVAAQVMAVYNDAALRLGPAAAEEGAPYTPLFADPACRDPGAAASFCAGLRRAITLGGDADWAPLKAEWPQWFELIDAPEPAPAAVLALLAPMRRYWRGRTDRLEPLRHSDLIGQLREAFEFFRRPFPSQAVALAERHREVVAPWLVQVLQDIAQDPEQALQEDYVLHHFAMVLLGHWRDTRAYRPLLALARLPYEIVDELFGDLLFETFDRALASVCDGDVAPLSEIVADDQVSVWVRMTVIEAWLLLVVEGDAPLEPLEACLQAVGEREAARLRSHGMSGDDPSIIEAVVSAAADIGAADLGARALAWFDEGLIDTRHIGRAEFEEELRVPIAHRRQALRARGRSYLRDPQTEIGWWADYHDEPAPQPQRARPGATTAVRDSPKVGRNDPCPCGSGRNYKKCHGAT